MNLGLIFKLVVVLYAWFGLRESDDWRKVWVFSDEFTERKRERDRVRKFRNDFLSLSLKTYECMYIEFFFCFIYLFFPIATFYKPVGLSGFETLQEQ